MAPHTPQRSEAPRPSRGAPRSGASGPDLAPHTPPRSEAPRPSRGAPRSGASGPDMAPHTPPRSEAPRPSRGAPRSGASGPDMAPPTPPHARKRPGQAVALLDPARAAPTWPPTLGAPRVPRGAPRLSRPERV